MKISFFVCVIALALSTSATAGIEERKAKQAKRILVESTNKSLIKTKKMCGNSKIKVRFDFRMNSAFMKANMDKLKTKHVVYAFADRNTSTMLSNLSKICAESEYKVEAAKLDTIFVSPSSDYTDMSGSFELSDDGKTLTVQLPTNPAVSLGYKKQIKAVW